MKKHKWKEVLLLLWDTTFVLILCFSILLVTMLVTKSQNAEPVTGYHVSILKLSAVVVALAVYLYFMLRESLKGQRDMVKKYFIKRESGIK